MAIPILGILAAAGGSMGMASMFPPLHRSITQKSNSLVPNEYLPIGEYIELATRKVIQPGLLEKALGTYGHTAGNAAYLMKLREQLIGIIELVTLWRREKIGDGELYDEAEKLGWKQEAVDQMIQFTETVPGVQDIVRFAVREVYSPEIMATFGQGEGGGEVSETAKKDLKAAGISAESLGKYWAAHWDLPSVGQGFEMLHRGVITEDILAMLLRALDIMPYWRDKLTKISYNPLTRVDVRRMHKLGILDESAVLQAYKNIGYNDEDAASLLAFTIEYNKDPEASEQTDKDKEKAKEKDLTKAEILSGYEDGIFSDADTRDTLTLIGYDADEADYYIAKVDMKRDRDLVSKFVTFYHNAYLANVVTQAEAQDGLNKLNLAGSRIEMLFSLWDMEKRMRTQKPTKAEILTFLRKKVIDEGTAIAELVGLGYSQKYIDWYMATA